LLTAADEKIPLSVVHVKKKPPYLVFCLHSRHQLHKQRQFSVESSIRLAGRGFLRAACSSSGAIPQLSGRCPHLQA
jgi:hypothetical protein